ncbi:ABC transporter permease [Candidatus Oscillochloris fontis]|uniref:ABC transporter permease n=1 Tax=Candidatus Oscillochloris fontis TaxID=2496868 RepID=UPI00101D1A9C|nr:ABC transporter permease [Candidatus Oscillochloris fontis]
MNTFLAAFWAETLKARRSKVALLTAAGFLILPIVDGLFMFILKDPERARTMGLIGVKAQITAGVADWPTFFQMLLLGTATGAGILFAFITAWVFGREFSDHTVKELLALPTPRGIIVGAKFVVIALWMLGLTLMIFVIGLGIGTVVTIPDWSPELQWASFWSLMLIVLITSMLVPFVALFASAGRGYMLPLGWAILTMALAQIAIVMGWGDWFPWSVPGLIASLSGASTERIELHSYIVVSLAFIVGIAATFAWWRNADQAQ